MRYFSNMNPVVRFLDKAPENFTKDDIIRFVTENGIEMLNFHYVAEDGRLKTLNFVINSIDHLNELLSSGERVDGSSLFSHIKTGYSDLYVIPRLKTAFVNPFEEVSTISLLCTFFTKDGEPLESAPDMILRKAHENLRKETGFELQALGELEYYVIMENDHLFQATDQRGYHESPPFNKSAQFRKEAVHLIASCGGHIKYAHSEVGNFLMDNMSYEQSEIEFNLSPVEDAADQLVVAKWILRNLAQEYGYMLTFSPKITIGKAGSGLHIHTRLMKDGKNMMVKDGDLSDLARKVIAGFLELAPSLTAFGNTNPSSYFRLVPNQEAPTTICWGDLNRNALVRVPLGWKNKMDMLAKVNPQEKSNPQDFSYKQTVEFRAPDGSASVHHLLAGLCVAANYGLQSGTALEIAQNAYLKLGEGREAMLERNLKTLPDSCVASAGELQKQKDIYTRNNVFTDDIIDQMILNLQNFNDSDLREKIEGNIEELLYLVKKHFHCG
jgi:glutamine synthetase